MKQKKSRPTILTVFILLIFALVVFENTAISQGKVLNPPGGIWTANIGGGTLTCPHGGKTVPAAPDTPITITILEDGDQMKFSSPQGTGILTRTAKGPVGGVYQGPISGTEGSINLDLMFVEIKGIPQMVGEMTRKPARGCHFTRSIYMEWSRATTKIKYINK